MFVNGLKRKVRELTRSERPKFLWTMFRGDLQLFLRYFFYPAVEFVKSLENQVKMQKLVLQRSFPTRAAVPCDQQAAVPDDQQAAIPELCVDIYISFL